MRKGQSFIVEFLLFFVISFSLFTAISYYFYNQNEFFKKKVGKTTTELVNDLIATNIIKGVTCKACDEVLVSEDIPSQIGGFYYIVKLDDYGLNTTLFIPQPFSKQTPLFNLNETYEISSENESMSENKIVEVKINNVGKEIGVR
jgi:hypothetical protein